ncbi:hypothetical protein AtubIFM57143_001720 [Aspergillus tubingensis]|nr:hypothetical protein AtubIFM57143_001720 [Aspergillus tubingensis]
MEKTRHYELPILSLQSSWLSSVASRPHEVEDEEDGIFTDSEDRKLQCLTAHRVGKLTASSKTNLEEMISREFRSLALYFILTQSPLSITVAPLAIDTNHNLSEPGGNMINAE